MTRFQLHVFIVHDLIQVVIIAAWAPGSLSFFVFFAGPKLASYFRSLPIAVVGLLLEVASK
jgi:hypothetical protein